MLLVEKIAEEKIREAIEKGEFRELRLKGKPYRFDGYLYEDPERRIEMKILRDHDLLPLPLQLKKEIDGKLEALRADLRNFRSLYLKKIARLVDLLEIELFYPLDQYERYLNRHRRFLKVHLPLWLQVKGNSDTRLLFYQFRQMVNEKRKEFRQNCARLNELIEQYNQEIVKATFKDRDMMRHFTTIGTRVVNDLLREFEIYYPVC